MSHASLLGLCLALLSLLPTALVAQQRPAAESIGSDRPGLGDGAHVLGTGVWQLEAGLTAVGGGDTEGSGSALIRWGITPLEFRFYLPSPIFSRGDAGTEFGDLGVGVKVGLVDSGSWTLSVVGGATLPTGTNAATADESTGFATLIGETPLGGDIALALNLGYATPFDAVSDGTLSVIATPSFVLGEGLSAYAGYAGFLSDGPDAHFLEGGLAIASRADLQLDLNGGWDLESEDWFLGFGVAIRRR